MNVQGEVLHLTERTKLRLHELRSALQRVRACTKIEDAQRIAKSALTIDAEEHGSERIEDQVLVEEIQPPKENTV